MEDFAYAGGIAGGHVRTRAPAPGDAHGFGRSVAENCRFRRQRTAGSSGRYLASQSGRVGHSRTHGNLCRTGRSSSNQRHTSLLTHPAAGPSSSTRCRTTTRCADDPDLGCRRDLRARAATPAPGGYPGHAGSGQPPSCRAALARTGVTDIVRIPMPGMSGTAVRPP